MDMRFRFAIISLVLLLLVFPANHLRAEEKDYFTLSGGWMWPVGGPVKDSYQPGFTLAGSFRAGITDHYLSGIEFGYTWLTLDTEKLETLYPGSTFSGGDMGLMSITTENDYIFGSPESVMRPFINTGLGFYRSFIDDALMTTGSETEIYSTGVYKGSFFGFHGGIGALINRDRFGLRLDANYTYLFQGGPNLEFFSARVGFIFYLQDKSTETEDEAD
jgi:hypothetical protein